MRGGAVLVAIGVALACGERADTPDPAAPVVEIEAESPAVVEPPRPASNLIYLREQVGQYPREIGLFETEPLHARLVALVGEHYPALVEAFGTQGPLSADGFVLYAIGNKPHAAGDEQAIVLIDLERDLINVKLMNPAELQEFRARSEAIEAPVEVQTTIANWEDLANDAE
jgi:hypothetical protein